MNLQIHLCNNIIVMSSVSSCCTVYYYNDTAYDYSFTLYIHECRC